MPNISQSKGNPTIKYGQLIEYIKINIFVQKLCYAESKAGRLVLDLLLFLEKAYYVVKTGGPQLSFNIFR